MALPDSPAEFEGQTTASPTLVYLAGCYVLSGASSVADFLGPFGCLTYRHDEDSATPDVGDDLDAGTWADAAEIPFNDANYGEYTTLGDEGVVTTDYGGAAAIPGPYGDSRIVPNDEIVGASWLVRRGSSGFEFHYGKTPHGDPGVDNTSAVDLGGVPGNHLIVSEDAGDVPTMDDDFQYGFKAVTPSGFPPSYSMYGCLCSLLIKLASLAAREITLGCGLAGRDKNRNILVG